MDKDKVKEQLGDAAAKAKGALAEIKANFKADEGTTGFRKVQSMFVNLWKSGTTGKGALIACSVVVLLLLRLVFSGGGKSGAASGGKTAEVASGESAGGTSAAVAQQAKRSVPADTLVVKGLYMRMPGDEALEACKEMIASSGDLVVVDFRNGIEREKDEATKAKEKKAYEEAVKMAETDVEQFLKWSNPAGSGYDPKAEGYYPKKNSPEDVGKLSLPMRKGDIGGDFPLSAAAELADKHGYQMEWMLPGKKYTTEPQTVGSFVVHASEKSGIEVSKGKGNVSKGKGNAKVSVSRYAKLESQVQDYSSGRKEYKEIARPIFAAKGLEPLELSSSKIWFRLTLNDAKGKPVTKTTLTKAFLRLNPTLRIQGKLTFAQKEIAEKFVDSYLQWVEFGNNNEAYFMKKSDPHRTGEKVSSIIGAEINNTSDEAIMMSLAMECHLKVEWGLPARSIKPEEAIETVTIPAHGKSMWDAMHTLLDSNEERKRLLESKGFGGVVYERGWMRLILKTTNGVEVAKADVVKNWLASRGYYPPSDKLTIAKKNLIEIAIKNEGAREDQLNGLCFVWIDNQDNVKEVYFNEAGMSRLFNAADLSGEEFAKSLVNNYSEIPSLKSDVKRENPGRGMIQTTTWIHKDPRGYQVKLFERAYFNNGVKYNKTMLERDVEVAMALSLVDKLPKKFFTVVAIQPESARKFD